MAQAIPNTSKWPKVGICPFSVGSFESTGSSEKTRMSPTNHLYQKGKSLTALSRSCHVAENSVGESLGYDASTCQNDRRHAKRAVPVDMPNKIVSVDMQKMFPSTCQRRLSPLTCQKSVRRCAKMMVSVNMPKECPSMCQNDGVRQHAKNLCPSTCQNNVP